MNFPVHITFKLLAFAPQMYVIDASGQSLGYVKQKLLRFIDDVTIYSDETQMHAIYGIKADRVIDFSANYHFSDTQGRSIGRVARKGLASLWRAHYIVYVGEEPAFEVQEEKPFVRLLDALLDEIPFVGFLSGLFLNPTYLVTRQNGDEALRITKARSLLETDFRIDQLGELTDPERECALLATMMIVLLERHRG